MTSRHRHWRPQLTRSEFYRGWVFFALYILVFPRLMGALQKALGEHWQLLPAEYGLIYYLLAVTLVVLVFWSFLYHGVHILLDWLPENLFAFATGLAGAGVFHFLASRIPLPVEDPFYPLYAEQFAYFPGATVLILVVLTPIVEEVLFRGLMFGSLRKYSRSLGYVVSILVYAFYAAQQYAFTPGTVDLRYLLLMVRYLPSARLPCGRSDRRRRGGGAAGLGGQGADGKRHRRRVHHPYRGDCPRRHELYPGHGRRLRHPRRGAGDRLPAPRHQQDPQ